MCTLNCWTVHTCAVCGPESCGVLSLENKVPVHDTVIKFPRSTGSKLWILESEHPVTHQSLTSQCCHYWRWPSTQKYCSSYQVHLLHIVWGVLLSVLPCPRHTDKRHLLSLLLPGLGVNRPGMLSCSISGLLWAIPAPWGGHLVTGCGLRGLGGGGGVLWGGIWFCHLLEGTKDSWWCRWPTARLRGGEAALEWPAASLQLPHWLTSQVVA